MPAHNIMSAQLYYYIYMSVMWVDTNGNLDCTSGRQKSGKANHYVIGMSSPICIMVFEMKITVTLLH